ncbi:MAG TPA: hypothetical protein VGK81_10395 [Anaerolineae bacterium]|jgi:hypothetical protein
MQLNVDAWYHGSPVQLDILRTGSTITPYRHVAEVFSHKPSMVRVDDAGFIQHNGSLPGYLYVVEETLSDADVYMHPRSTMQVGWEWLTRRDLPLRLLGVVSIAADEQLSDSEVAELVEQAKVAAATEAAAREMDDPA